MQISFRSLIACCFLCCVLSLLVAGFGIRDFKSLPDPESIVGLRPIAPAILSFKGSKLDTELIDALVETNKGAESIRLAAKASIEVARDGARERTVLGFGFAFIFALLARLLIRMRLMDTPDASSGVNA